MIPRLDLIQTTASVIQTIAVTGGLIFSGYQLAQINRQNTQEKTIASATLSIELDKRLQDKSYSDVLDVLRYEHNDPVVLPSSKLKESQIDQLLNVYETIGDLYKNNILTCDMIFNEFSDDIINIYNNRDIKKYLIDNRKNDENLWVEFQKMGELFANSKSNPCKD